MGKRDKNKKKQQHTPRKSKETSRSWPVAAIDALKEVALRTLLVGKFYQFGVIGILAILAWKIDSADFVEISKLFLDSRVYSGLGWALFAVSSLAYVALTRRLTAMYKAEIKRLSDQRTEHQQASGNDFVGTQDLKRIEGGS